MTSEAAQSVAPPWAVMWGTGVVVFFAVKAATAMTASGWTPSKLALYVTQAPTLDPRPVVERGEPWADGRWWTAFVGIASAVVVWSVLVPACRHVSDWLAGLAVMAGVVCGLHFGAFRLITAVLNRLGYAVRPVMQQPWKSRSLAEFWGRRWNTAFRDAASLLVVRPLRRRLPARWITAVVFLASGVIHDVVMSAAAGGWGRPTAYFLIQAVGVAVQRTRPARRVGLADGLRGTLFTAAWVLLPLPLLFHRPFCAEVMLPFYEWCAGWLAWDGTLGRATLAHIGGWMQWSILLASATAPFALDWRREFAPLSPLLRQMFWVYGGYIVGAIVSLGAASVFFADTLAAGGLGRGVLAVTTAFWGVRLLCGLFVFDARPFLLNRWLEAGYALLTVGFVSLTVLYAALAVS